jgi:hypothetical protein
MVWIRLHAALLQHWLEVGARMFDQPRLAEYGEAVERHGAIEGEGCPNKRRAAND